MAIDLKKIAKEIKLDLSDVPRNQRSQVKQEVGNFVVEEILRSVSSASTPVSGGKYKATLSKDYADEEKGGNRTANLELEGDMLDSLEFKNTREGVEVGIFKASEVPKADGHNNFSGKSKLPTRQFIPKENEKFKRNIEKGIKDIVNEFKVSPEPRIPSTSDLFRTVSTLQADEVATTIAVNELFDSEDFLDEFLREQGIL